VLFSIASGCFAKAGDCEGAFAVFNKNYTDEGLTKMDAATKAKYLDKLFDSTVQMSAPQCKRSK